jgi:hypothetical protein
MVLGKHIRALGYRYIHPCSARRVSCCSGTTSGLLCERIPAAGNQTSRTQTLCLSLSKHTYPGYVKTVYTQCGKCPVRVSCCSGTISGLFYEQIPAAGNQTSRIPHPHTGLKNPPPTTQYTVPDLIPLSTEGGFS